MLRAPRSGGPGGPPPSALYESEWGTEFWAFVRAAMRPGVAVLDVGAGRRPTISLGDRPEGSSYMGLDVSAEELEASPPGSYDETVAVDVQEVVPALADRFDLIVAWQALEHVADLPRAMHNLHRYARDGGWFVACLSGRHAVFAVANRLMPNRVGRGLVARLMRRPIDTVFPAHYDHCDDRGLRGALVEWDELHVIPLWRGADYFDRFPRLRSAYVYYEDWAFRRGLTNLATHYIVAARKGDRGS
jgi:SAM-dependent methyltransferase